MKRDRPGRHTTVAASERMLSIEPLIMNAGTDVLKAIRTAAQHPATRVIGVVDDGGHLVGVLPILRLAEAVVARVAPEAIMSTLTDLADIASFSHSVEARTVGEAMLDPVGIAPTATIDDAFRRMHARHQSGIYVVDDEGHPIGYLDLLELALVYADVLEASPAERSDDTGAL
jgi:CBS domain-containing protein